MLRNFVALTILAVTGMLLLPDTSSAAGGMRAGGGMRGAGFRAPFIVHRNARAGILRQHPRGIAMPRPSHFAPRVSLPLSHVRIPPAATSAANYLSRIRLSHRAYISGWSFPLTTSPDAAYIGTPYDPAEAIPVYAPYLPENPPAPAARPLLPRLTNAAEENPNGDACRSERVTVPAAEGEREILVVRC